MSAIWSTIFLLFSLILGGRQLDAAEADGNTALVSAISQLAGEFFSDCHLVLLSETVVSGVFSEILRGIRQAGVGVLVVDSTKISRDLTFGSDLVRGIWGDTSTTCTALLVELTEKFDSKDLFRFFEVTDLAHRPEISVVFVGPKQHVDPILLHSKLKNTIHAFYLALENKTLDRSGEKVALPLKEMGVSEDQTTLRTYRRCLYCYDGEPGVESIGRWTPILGVGTKERLFPDEFKNFHGHKFMLTCKKYFPYIDAEPISSTLVSRLVLLDSLDTRIFNALSSTLNFTFEAWSTADSEFGVSKGDGNWTGMVGELQHEKADFSPGLTPTMARMEVVDFSRVYIPEPYIVLSRKPQPPPQYLSIFRPLTVNVWVAVILSIFAFGILLWMLQKAWAHFAGTEARSLSKSIMYAWGVTLEDAPSDPPQNPSSQMLVGWWLIFCLVVTTAYKSALIAHLTVQLESAPVDTFEDLLKQDGWQWGISQTGSAIQSFFITSPDPVIKALGKSLLKLTLHDRAGRILRGKFATVEPMYYWKALIARNFTSKSGYTPFHIGRREYSIFAGLALAYRRGAPFLKRFSQLQQRMIEAGLMRQWIDTVLEEYSSKARRTNNMFDEEMFLQADSGPVVLSLHHLQGAFYLLFIGCTVGALVLVGERLLV